MSIYEFRFGKVVELQQRIYIYIYISSNESFLKKDYKGLKWKTKVDLLVPSFAKKKTTNINHKVKGKVFYRTLIFYKVLSDRVICVIMLI